MEWELKLELSTYLNNGENDKACELILNNDMDLQAWDMFISGMSLRDYEYYKPLLSKIKEASDLINENLGFREIFRLNMLILKLEEN